MSESRRANKTTCCHRPLVCGIRLGGSSCDIVGCGGCNSRNKGLSFRQLLHKGTSNLLSAVATADSIQTRQHSAFDKVRFTAHVGVPIFRDHGIADLAFINGIHDFTRNHLFGIYGPNLRLKTTALFAHLAGRAGRVPCCHAPCIPGTEGTCQYHTVMTSQINSLLIKSLLNIETLTSTRSNFVSLLM